MGTYEQGLLEGICCLQMESVSSLAGGSLAGSTLKSDRSAGVAPYCCISLGQFFSFRGGHGSTETMSRCSRSALNKEIVGWGSPTIASDND